MSDQHATGISRADAKRMVGPGWAGLIDDAYNAIEGVPDCWVSDVKEKFGGLRIYFYGAAPDLAEVIDAICARSETVCEMCGGPGKPRGPGWIKTVCDEHARETGREL